MEYDEEQSYLHDSVSVLDDPTFITEPVEGLHIVESSGVAENYWTPLHGLL